MKSRKLWFAVILMAIYVVSAFVGKADEIMKVSTPLLTIFGTYVIGNVGSKLSHK